MSVTMTLDGTEVSVEAGTNLVEAAAKHGVYIPTLCYVSGKPCLGTCRACTVRVDGRITVACGAQAHDGARVEVNTPELAQMRRQMVELLFVEGVHNCPSCEKSGRCQLQSVAYEVGMHAASLRYRFPKRQAEHACARLWLERDRCILCHRCVDFVRDRRSGKKIFAMSGRGEQARIEVDVALADAMPEDQLREAVDLCPVGAILRKGVGYDEPIGQRRNERRSPRQRQLEEDQS